MPRNCKRRNIWHNVISKFFKPNWIPLHNLEITEIWQDEIEALRLAYIENLNMIQWAQKMWVSAPTFNRILNSWIWKIAQALVYSKAIKIL